MIASYISVKCKQYDQDLIDINLQITNKITMIQMRL